MIRWISIGPLPTAGEIDELQRELQAQFPEAFRKHLLDVNVVEPEPNFFSVGDKKRHGGLRVLFGISSDPEKDLRAQWRKNRKRLPAHSVPIGAAEGGNLVCLNAVTGAIEFWDHELSRTQTRGLELIASSFSDFVGLLRPQDVELAPGDVREAWVDPDFMASLRKKQH